MIPGGDAFCTARFISSHKAARLTPVHQPHTSQPNCPCSSARNPIASSQQHRIQSRKAPDFKLAPLSKRDNQGVWSINISPHFCSVRERAVGCFSVAHVLLKLISLATLQFKQRLFWNGSCQKPQAAPGSFLVKICWLGSTIFCSAL